MQNRDANVSILCHCKEEGHVFNRAIQSETMLWLNKQQKTSAWEVLKEWKIQIFSSDHKVTNKDIRNDMSKIIIQESDECVYYHLDARFQ